jgi:hypothetical protein
MTGAAPEEAGGGRLALLLAMAMFVLVVDTSLMNVSTAGGEGTTWPGGRGAAGGGGSTVGRRGRWHVTQSTYPWQQLL